MSIEQELPELPEGINVPMIEMIHTGKDAFIPFMRKNPETGKMENLFSLPRESLRTYFPELLHWLTVDAYMGVNSTYRPAPWINKRTGLPDALRGEGLAPGSHPELRYLNAVYADLDVGRPDDSIAIKRTPWAKALAVAEILMNEGKIPQATIYANSGRGLYLLWLIRDPADVNLPQNAWREKILLYRDIERALTRRLHHKLAADPHAIDAARVLKAPGTIDSKTGRRVGYWFRLDDQGMPFLHTLESLASALKPGQSEKELLPPGGYLQPLPAMRKVKEKGKYPNRMKGWEARNIIRLKDFLKIEAWMRGFPDGMRRRSLTMLAEFMKFSGVDRKDIRTMLEIKAKNCRPPYPSSEKDTSIEEIIKGVLSSGSRLSRSGDAAICRDYGITSDVSVQLELESIMPVAERARRLAEIKVQDRESKKDHWANIQAAVKRLWNGSGKNYSYRTIRDVLQRDLNLSVSHETIRRWFMDGKIDKRFKPLSKS